MNGPLEKFVQENRDKFDAEIPGPRIWEKISERLDPSRKEKETPVRSLPFKRWLSAAAVVAFLCLITALYFSLQHKVRPELAIKKTGKTEPSNHLPVSDSGKNTAATPITKKSPAPATAGKPADPIPESADNGESKEMYYYAKLIEIKHEELKTLEKDEPLLYRQFSGDVQKLDGVYHSLKTQLPNTSNREQVMEAMISNLQLQIGLLNRQLKIIKQIKNSKKSAYEKAYKSV